MKLTLKKANKKDLPIISKIYMEEFSKPPYNEPWTMKKALGKMKFFDKFYDLYTIKLDNKIAGFICINPLFMCPGEVAFGEEIAIKEEFQNKGVGTRVINEIFAIYKKRKFKRFMGIADTEGKVINLYKKLGFNPSKKDILIEKELN